MARPTVYAIFCRYAGARVDFLGNPYSLPVLMKDPWVRNFIPFPSRTKTLLSALRILLISLKLKAVHYNLLLLLQPVLNKASHNRLTFLARCISAEKSIGRKSSFGKIFLDIAIPDDPGKHEVDRMLSLTGNGSVKALRELYLLPGNFGTRITPVLEPDAPFAVLGPGGNKRSRRWPLGNFLQLADLLTRAGLNVAFVGDESERVDLVTESLPSGCHNLVGRTSLEDLASLIRRANVVVANDSGVMHLANALGTPVVGIFGSGDEIRTRPYLTDLAETVDSRPMDCKPCYQDDCKNLECMKSVTVERVWSAVNSLLRKVGFVH